MKVTLLGTGTPLPLLERFGPSILVQAGGASFVFDTGRGCLQRMKQLNFPYDSLTAVFFTHLHSDHLVGLPDLWLTGWLTTRCEAPLRVFGPKGTKNMTDHLQAAYVFDIKMRVQDDHAPKTGGKLETKEIQEGVVFEQNGVKVTGFLVDHYPIVPAFGYKIEYRGHSVVVSGDTRYSDNLIKYAKGTDLLIHEVAVAPDTMSSKDSKYHILAHHITPEQASKVFNAVKPKLAVYSHIVRLYDRTNEELLQRTKNAYTGPLVLGEDLMSFSVNETVAVKAWVKK
ncbi:MBL fold metallo-hydrolase [Rufibacter hautae]|uniref:MBL fold metallo-hydrolase n=1 Tax=Rufibacter hautae TaxID=2595005 RepID=A0A5B6THS8_9BACT|nr:MBL fold metallo-hydrolase [Rufibacter hautae]